MALTFLSKIVPEPWIPYLKFIRAPWNFHLLQKDKFHYATDKLYTEVNTEFKQDPRFAAAYAWVTKLGGTLVPKNGMEWRIYMLCWAADQVKHLPGDFVACGVFSGFCDRAIMQYIDFAKTDKRYYLMDTFQGLDPRYSSDYEIQRNHTMGYEQSRNLYEQVQETFKDFNVRIIKGAIPDTLPQADTEQICFLSIDMNAVVPEVAALEHFWPKLVRGAVVIFDDYGFPTCEAQKHGHDAFAKKVGHTIFTSPTGQGILIKQF
ncbi:TylF/MycF/NovP-related O-methyltransferase [Siphonobacter curvatus]|uniref:Methyltransferase n=1 Tax=Siphonobacter curvatus TaxID=2094562 RepID=A0A2S7IRK2_9BACT|nr:TylF/MycF/NovP-related O-methyltransferase [Siphonobacter curvatus]PQA60351.1 methyltransferase [Siphonobacter curvatus]